VSLFFAKYLEKMAQDFGDANFLLTVDGNSTLLKCESRAQLNHFWLFKKIN